jgi:hypothetical protein
MAWRVLRVVSSFAGGIIGLPNSATTTAMATHAEKHITRTLNLKAIMRRF